MIEAKLEFGKSRFLCNKSKPKYRSNPNLTFTLYLLFFA